MSVYLLLKTAETHTINNSAGILREAYTTANTFVISRITTHIDYEASFRVGGGTLEAGCDDVIQPDNPAVYPGLCSVREGNRAF